MWICEKNHPKICHYCKQCPLCETITDLKYEKGMLDVAHGTIKNQRLIIDDQIKRIAVLEWHKPDMSDGEKDAIDNEREIEEATDIPYHEGGT